MRKHVNLRLERMKNYYTKKKVSLDVQSVCDEASLFLMKCTSIHKFLIKI